MRRKVYIILCLKGFILYNHFIEEKKRNAFYIESISSLMYINR